MSNLTISLDDSVVRNARVRAIQQGTSISAKIREFLAAYATGAPQRLGGDATADLMRMMADVRSEIEANKLQSQSAQSGDSSLQKRSVRDELYEGDFRARDRIGGA